jgi:hypothetical protein
MESSILYLVDAITAIIYSPGHATNCFQYDNLPHIFVVSKGQRMVGRQLNIVGLNFSFCGIDAIMPGNILI